MSLIDSIKERFSLDEFEFSRHATDQSLRRSISVDEVRQASSRAQIIEDYPDDKYGPSCLLLGFTNARRALHIHCSYPSRSRIKLITLYEPALEEWLEYKTRKPQP